MRKCAEYQMVYSKALGKEVKRCKSYSGAGKCVSYKEVYSPALGHTVKRCADFEGGGAGA